MQYLCIIIFLFFSIPTGTAKSSGPCPAPAKVHMASRTVMSNLDAMKSTQATRSLLFFEMRYLGGKGEGGRGGGSSLASWQLLAMQSVSS